MNTLPFVTVFGALLGIAATVLLYIFILPEKKRERLPKILKVLHDIFNFKGLMLETILRFLYTLSTVLCILVGFMMLFGFQYYDSYYYSYSHWYGLEGLIIMILGPIALRIAFELVMMFILLVKNVMAINNKLKGDEKAPAAEQAPAANYTAPTQQAPTANSFNSFDSNDPFAQ